MFAFDTGGATGWIDDATDAILDRFEPGSAFESGGWNTSIPGEGHKGVSRYRGELDAGGETLAIELVNDWPQPKVTVDGTSLDFELRRYVGYDIVLSAPLGDGRELWLAVRHNFFATALGGVGWIVEPGAAMLPYELLLIRQRD